MKRLLLSLAVQSFVWIVAEGWCEEQGCKTKALLDSFAQFRGEASYPDDIWRRLESCWMNLSQADLNVIDAQDNAWNEFVTYLINNEPADNPQWIEYNPTPLAKSNNTVPGSALITIGEPCNTVSNLVSLVRNPSKNVNGFLTVLVSN